MDVENEIGDDEFQGNSLNRGPYFEVSASKNITAIAGQSAYLNCRVRNLGNRTVSGECEESVFADASVFRQSFLFVVSS